MDVAAAAVATLDLANSPPQSPSSGSTSLPTLDHRRSTSSSSRDPRLSSITQDAASLSPQHIKDDRNRQSKGKLPLRLATNGEHRLRRTSEGTHNLRNSQTPSWTSATRDSLVDNLLDSLGNLTGGESSQSGTSFLPDFDFDKDRFRPPEFSSTMKHFQRVRGHTHSSSLSSEHDPTPRSSDSPLSSPSTKGRRSISGSNFAVQSAAGRTKVSSPITSGSTRASTDTQKPVGRTSYAMEGKENLGSFSPRDPSRLSQVRKSMSLDHLYNDAAAHANSVMDRGRPIPSFDDDDYEGAPVPTISQMPRQLRSPSAPAYTQTPTRSTTLRKTTTQNDLRRGTQSNTALAQDMRDRASDFVKAANTQNGSITALPQDFEAPAPSPTLPTAGRRDTPPQHQQRQGFFKRVFKNNQRDPHSSIDDLDRTNAFMRPSSSGGIANPRSAGSAAKMEQPRQATKQPTQPISYASPTLNKKPSSFFRRRKKSIGGDNPPPVPQKDSHLSVQLKDQSPSASSLRKVMDPYLADEAVNINGASRIHGAPLSRSDTLDSFADSDELDIFHSGYTPPPDASLGKRIPTVLAPRAFSNPDSHYGQGASPSPVIKLKKRDTDTSSPTSTTNSAADAFVSYNYSRDPTLGDNFDLPTDTRNILSADTLPGLKQHLPPVNTDSAREGARNTSSSSKGDTVDSPTDAMRTFSAGTNVSVSMEEDDYWFHKRGTRATVTEKPSSKGVDKLRLKADGDPMNKRRDSADTIPATPDSRESSRGASMVSTAPAVDSTTSTHMQSTPSTEYHSATSLPLPSVLLEGNDLLRKSIEVNGAPTPPPKDGLPGADYREKAQRIFDGDEQDVSKQEAASWLGEQNALSSGTLLAYLQLFDFQGLSILAALRMLCNKLLLRGETQQFDRIITALSSRWCECNPKHGFKAQDVVHTIVYSLILLNTDLHMADIGEKMSRSAYVKNTLPTIRRVVLDAAPNAFDDTIRPNGIQTRPSIPWMDSNGSIPTSPRGPSPVVSSPDTPTDRTSLDTPRVPKRLSLRPGMLSDGMNGDGPNSSSTSLTNSPWSGTMRGWEAELETVLKSFFTSIRAEPLPLLSITNSLAADRNPSGSSNTGLKRTGSVISKAPSDNMSLRSKPSGFRGLAAGWNSRTRSRQKLYPTSSLAASSRTSFDDGNSMWSPAGSTSNWSKYSLAKTLTSASVGSLGYHFTPRTDFKHSIGFANALSQAIIREETTGGPEDTDSLGVPTSLLEDEALALEGAPWAKEGLVKHKQHRDNEDRKSKERNWSDSFAVISKGKLTLFAFGTSTKSQSMGRKTMSKNNNGRAASIAGARVGGGDWMENAEQLDAFVLRQTIASVLPPPGYGKNRPHVWALSLPSGAVHLFQVGTPEIAKEFMTTANYWSARLSKEPLSGGVSNIEYGWSDNVINPALAKVSEDQVSPPASSYSAPMSPQKIQPSPGGSRARSSFQSSVRGSFDTSFGNNKIRLHGDKAQIADWHPPTQSMMASQLLEVDQHKALLAYVKNVENELAKHNELKQSIELTYSPRHANYTRVLANWQRKSDYLLREFIKFQTYADTLEASQKSWSEYLARKAKMDEVREKVTTIERERMTAMEVIQQDGEITPRAVTRGGETGAVASST